MAWNRLRIYRGPEEGSTVPATASLPPELVTARLDELVPWLVDAALRRRVWLQDLADEEITLSRDLYEVIRAYARQQRPSA